MRIFIGLALVVGLFLLVLWSYRMNKKTLVPKGCENLTPDCKGCGIRDCTLRTDMMNKIEEELKKDDDR